MVKMTGMRRMRRMKIVALTLVLAVIGASFGAGYKCAKEEYALRLKETQDLVWDTQLHDSVLDQINCIPLLTPSKNTADATTGFARNASLDQILYLWNAWTVRLGPYQATMLTEPYWTKNSCSSVEVNLSAAVFNEACNVKVYYPKQVAAGDTGAIFILIQTKSDEVYFGYTYFRAADDLEIIYGSSDPNASSDGELNVVSEDCLEINFYTSATGEHRSHRKDYIAQSEDSPLTVEFKEY